MGLRCPCFEFSMPVPHSLIVQPGGAEHFHPNVFVHCRRKFIGSKAFQHVVEAVSLGLQCLHFMSDFLITPFQNLTGRLSSRYEQEMNIMKRQTGLPEMANPLELIPIRRQVETIALIGANRRWEQADAVIIEQRAPGQME